MTRNKANPFIGELKAGADHRILLDVQDYDGNDRDYTGATVEVTFSCEFGTISAITGALSADPTVGPQAYFDIPADATEGLMVPQRIQFYAKVTLPTDKIDIPSGRFELISGSA